VKASWYLLRFFRVVTPLPGLVLWTFGVIVVGASTMVAVVPARTAGALAPLLLMQMFAASSGFAVPARRGHYDLLLTRTGNRWSIAVAHWLTSIAPGLSSWLIVAGVEALTTGQARVCLASGTYVAFALVSTLPWAVTVTLPRFSGGIGWLLVLTMAGITFSPDGSAWLAMPGRTDTSVASAWALLVYPMTSLGRHLSTHDLILLSPALMLAVASMGIACAWVARATFPLEAAQ
jgi:hypothetical protein